MTASASQRVETVTALEAIRSVLLQELQRDQKTLLLGETVRYVGAAGVTRGLFDICGPQQVIETPVSENAILGAALGLALSGYKPIVEIYSADFLLAVANEVINDIPKWRQQQALAGPLPIVIRGCMGANGGLGPEHSQSMEPYFHHAPGLTIVTPGTPADAAGLLRASIASPEPVLFFEHRKLYSLVGDVPVDEDFTVPLNTAEVVSTGDDVTIVAWGWMRQEAQQSLKQLEADGISAELIDPRTIRPMEWPVILASARRTGRLLVVEEAPATGSVASEVIARVAEDSDGAVICRRVAMADVIHPYSASMERPLLPTAEKISSTARELALIKRR